MLTGVSFDVFKFFDYSCHAQFCISNCHNFQTGMHVSYVVSFNRTLAILIFKRCTKGT